MIQVSSVYKSFRSKQVLRGLDLDVFDGETLTVIGGSGTGKSVLLKNIMGLLKPDQGEIRIDGKAITDLNDAALLNVQKKFGYLFQGAALFDSLTIEENVGFGLHNLTNFDETKISARVEECLAMVGLKGIQKLKPAELSGGMKKRVGLARAIACQPQYVMYDEPTTGLDPIMADVINELILHLQTQLRITSIVVTHDMKSAYKISNRIAMLYEGKIIFIGTPEEVKSTTNPVVHQFVEGLSHGPITVDIEKSFT
ncbi:MAG: ABC transporter ATP-binding protein [Endomicrobiales bacterium]|jgi:phospholipid/cholesterol/gamma-HCH transport system ATP-binding protein